ncbi:protein kinase domain-containing protein [Parabacteroides pacaensis]|uniref:protein kinase domain-containing protein n=1 Tax=Parabacteroides pacaensis TaxID=2086575 RepID=UPI000D0F7F5C|nr:protein kinase [Parabacteroides pacaensis]
MRNNNAVQRCDFRLHDLIDGKYRVERVLASSQNDQKFKVIDSEGKEYILILLKLWEIEPRLRQNMLACSDSEIKSCQIKSNYLAHIVKTGNVKGNPYLLTEYCESVDLSHFIRNPKLNLIRTIKEILYGLRDLHRSGKIHCRLTPENILVTGNGHVILTNYVILSERGKVLASQGKTLQSRFVDKSLAYQAPELYRLERCSTILPAVDIFSFGVIVFQLLTGELPYGKLTTESDWIHYQSRAKNTDWNKNILLRNEQRDLWMKILESCLSAEANGRAKNVDEIIELFPKDGYPYEGVPGSQVEAPKSIVNGVMLHVMQGDEFGKYYRLTEIIQLPKRIITVGRADNSVFNMIQLSEQISSYISRRHCTIELDDETDTWYLRDGQWDKEAKDKWVRSLNGTYINSEEVSEEGCEIVPGDIISIGDMKLRVEGY